MHLEAARVFVVAIQDGKRRRRPARNLKQALLGRQIVLHGSMEIQMNARESRKNRGVKM
jgi:hypothetical protein